MILTCPSCEARFNVEPDALLPNGRTVRCGRCAHTWKEMPPEDIPKRVEAAEPPAPAVPEPGDADDDDIGFKRGENWAVFGLPKEGDDAGVPKGEAPDGDGLDIQTGERQVPEYQAPQRRGQGRGSAIGWIAVAAIVTVALGGGFVARDAIIDMWPPASMLYEKIGLAPEPGFGLALRTEAEVQKRDGSADILVIRGEIVNVSSRPRLVPMLQGSLLDADQNDIHSWTFSTALGELAAGETRPFDARVPNPPEGVRNFRITFAGDGKG